VSHVIITFEGNEAEAEASVLKLLVFHITSKERAGARDLKWLSRISINQISGASPEVPYGNLDSCSN